MSEPIHCDRIECAILASVWRTIGDDTVERLCFAHYNEVVRAGRPDPPFSTLVTRRKQPKLGRAP